MEYLEKLGVEVSRKEIKRNRFLVLVFVLLIVNVVLLSLFVTQNVNNAKDVVAVNEEDEEKVRVEFQSTDVGEIEFICENITRNTDLFHPVESSLRFVVCIDEVVSQLCLLDNALGEQLIPLNCLAFGGTCNCPPGQFADARLLGAGANGNNACGIADPVLECVPLEDDLAIELEPIADLFQSDFDK